MKMSKLGERGDFSSNLSPAPERGTHSSEMSYSNKHRADSANSSSQAGPSARTSKQKRLAVSPGKSVSSRNLEENDPESVYSDSDNKGISGLLPSTSESGPSTL